MKKINVAMTASIGEEYQTIWGSGITQNILFLYQLFSKSDFVENIYILDLIQDPSQNYLDRKIGENTYKFINKEEAANKIDVIIEIGTQLWTELAHQIKQRGGKIVSMRCGNAYIDEVMGVFQDRPPLIPINNVTYDELWVLPHYGKNSAPMLQTLYRCPTKVVNYIWEPEFIELAASRLNTDYHYNPASNNDKPIARKIAICEPNLNPTKTFHIPLLICEEAYRNYPDYIRHVYAMNTWRLNSNPSLLHFVNRLDIFKNKACSFESRLDIVSTMTQTANVLVSHHWQNGMNNLYFDILYGGYPLIHNSEFMKDYGYYYEDFNAQAGAKQLINAIENHDNNLDNYRKHHHQLFQDYSLHNPKNIQHYTDLLQGVYFKNEAQKVPELI